MPRNDVQLSPKKKTNGSNHPGCKVSSEVVKHQLLPSSTILIDACSQAIMHFFSSRPFWCRGWCSLFQTTTHSFLHVCVLGFNFAKHFLYASSFLGFPVHSFPGLRDSSLSRHCSWWYCPCPLVVKARGQETGSGSPRADPDSLIFGGLTAVIPVA